jgi:AcrR family transcriptional regulator
MTSRPVWESRVVGQVLRPSEKARRARFLEATRKIVTLGIDLAAESDDGTFTVQELVDQAGISLHSFYRLFPSKDDLSLAIFEEACRLGTEAIAGKAASETAPLERLRTIIVAPINGDFEHPRGLTASYIRSEDLRLRRSHPLEVHAALAPYRRLLTDAISAAQEAEEFSGIDPAEDAEMIHLLVVSRYHLLAEGAQVHWPRPSGDVVWDFCLAALRRYSGTPNGRKRLTAPVRRTT